ncbi:uncharacterized protein VTP21DRAFT_6865 [Calcarisporiella thermophila]|uniref:uncharacterized protein n=1 Tax=Calcarisporiella thermophila TaxID=911321 RepID=UPI0037440EF2
MCEFRVSSPAPPPRPQSLRHALYTSTMRCHKSWRVDVTAPPPYESRAPPVGGKRGTLPSPLALRWAVGDATMLSPPGPHVTAMPAAPRHGLAIPLLGRIHASCAG